MNRAIQLMAAGLSLTVFTVPFVMGLRLRRRRACALAGWGLFIIFGVFQDLLAPALSRWWMGPEGPVFGYDQPILLPILLFGWFFGLAGGILGRALRLGGRLAKRAFLHGDRLT